MARMLQQMETCRLLRFLSQWIPWRICTAFRLALLLCNKHLQVSGPLLAPSLLALTLADAFTIGNFAGQYHALAIYLDMLAAVFIRCPVCVIRTPST